MKEIADISLPTYVPKDDALRLEALRELKILYTRPEESFDEITEMMKLSFDVPLAFISLVDENSVYFKSIAGDFRSTIVDRNNSICSISILNPGLTVYEDIDPTTTFAHFPDFTPPAGLKFYAGVPMFSEDGYALGTVCIADTKARNFSEKEGELLKHFGKLALREIRNRLETLTQTRVLEEKIRKAVDRLEQSETESQIFQLFLKAPVAITLFKGEEMVIAFANELAMKLSKQEGPLTGYKLIELYPEVKDQGFLDQLLSVYHSGQSYRAWEAPLTLNTEEGDKTFYFNLIYQPYYNKEGVVEGIISFASDVTEQVQGRKQLDLIEARSRLAVESAELGTIDVNLITNELFASRRLFEIFGLDESADRSLFASRIHPDDRQTRLSAYEQAYQTGILEFECRIIHETGSIRWIKVKGKVFFNSDKAPVRLYGVVLDITEQKDFASQLSVQVEERTAELNNAIELLRKKNEELDQFAYVTSHDLQEPLRKIQIFSSIIQDKFSIEEDIATYLEKISDSAERMQNLILNLLKYSRLSSGQPEFEEVDLNEIIGGVLNDLELLIQQKGANITISNLPLLRALPLQLEQLFSNLLGNALKFSKDGEGPKVSVKSEELSQQERELYPQLNKERTYYKISVSDSGIGFHPRYADKIFTIFQRLNDRAQYGGFGIGLALCKKIADNHEGLILADGKPGEGASFTVILPA